MILLTVLLFTGVLDKCQPNLGFMFVTFQLHVVCHMSVTYCLIIVYITESQPLLWVAISALVVQLLPH